MQLVGTSDTTVHMFRNPAGGSESRSPTQVAAWRPFVPAVGAKSPVISAWAEHSLFTSGNVPFVRAWDVERQYASMDFITGVNAGVTAMASTPAGALLVGFASGAVKVFDARQQGSDAKDLLGLQTCVMGLHVPLVSPNSVVAVGRDGQVRIWDIRAGSTKQANPLRSFGTKGKTEVSAFAVHNYAPVLAVGYIEQQIHLYNLQGEQTRVIRYHEGFLEERIGPIASLAFHPSKLVLAAASTDKFVSVFREDKGVGLGQ